MLECETLAGAAAGTALPVGYPTPEESRMLSPSAPACVAQDEVEPLLLDRLRAAPHAHVALGTELLRVVAGLDGARAVVRDVRTGATRTLHARHVVAADGARSAVRRGLGIAMSGPDRLMEPIPTGDEHPPDRHQPPPVDSSSQHKQARGTGGTTITRPPRRPPGCPCMTAGSGRKPRRR